MWNMLVSLLNIWVCYLISQILSFFFGSSICQVVFVSEFVFWPLQNPFLLDLQLKRNSVTFNDFFFPFKKGRNKSIRQNKNYKRKAWPFSRFTCELNVAAYYAMTFFLQFHFKLKYLAYTLFAYKLLVEFCGCKSIWYHDLLENSKRRRKLKFCKTINRDIFCRF